MSDAAYQPRDVPKMDVNYGHKLQRCEVVSGGQVYVGWKVTYTNDRNKRREFIMLRTDDEPKPPNPDMINRAIAVFEESE